MIDGSLEFLILASDGLWDVVSNEVFVCATSFPFMLWVTITFWKWLSLLFLFLLFKKNDFLSQEAVAIVRPIEDPEPAAKKLLQEAYQRGSADNITCVVVRFLSGQDSDAK